jgi:hypothetical protein
MCVYISQQHVHLQGQLIACAVRACCIGCASKQRMLAGEALCVYIKI